MLGAVAALLIRKHLKISQLTYLLHFLLYHLCLLLLLFLVGCFFAIGVLGLSLSLHFADSLFQNDSVLELVGNFDPKRGEVVGIEGPVYEVLFLAVVFEKGGTERLILNVFVGRRDEVDIFFGGRMGLSSVSSFTSTHDFI